MLMKLPNRLVLLVFSSVALFIIVLITYISFRKLHPENQFDRFRFVPFPTYKNQPKHSREWYNKHCFDNALALNLSKLKDNLQKWSYSGDKDCINLFRKFSTIYSVSFDTGYLNVPPELLKKFLSFTKTISSQELVHIHNKITGDYIIFNALRGKRPQGKPSQDPLVYVDNLVEESRKSCDFCNYLRFTSEELFGRIYSNFSVTAANTFKIFHFHSMVLSKKHHPLKLTEIEVVDMYNTAYLWFNKAWSVDKKYKFPWLAWDIFSHSGASQIHPHVQIGLDNSHYPGTFGILREGLLNYASIFGDNYFTDLREIHYALGLALGLGNATAVFQLTPRKDTEITILSENPNDDVYRLIYLIIQTYMKMGLYGFSSAGVYPIMGNGSDFDSLPVVYRIATRGDVADIKSDISSFDLFLFGSISVDPYEMVDHLKKYLSANHRKYTF